MDAGPIHLSVTVDGIAAALSHSVEDEDAQQKALTDGFWHRGTHWIPASRISGARIVDAPFGISNESEGAVEEVPPG
jgi:hypothetical protein